MRQKIIIIGSYNGLSPGRRQAIIWINARILVIGSLGIKFQWNFNRSQYILIQENAFWNVACKMASISSRPQCVYHGSNRMVSERNGTNQRPADCVHISCDVIENGLVFKISRWTYPTKKKCFPYQFNFKCWLPVITTVWLNVYITIKTEHNYVQIRWDRKNEILSIAVRIRSSEWHMLRAKIHIEIWIKSLRYIKLHLSLHMASIVREAFLYKWNNVS